MHFYRFLNKGYLILSYKIGIVDLLNQVEQIFIHFFSSFEHQIYLDCVKVKKFRIAMTKLRVASHRLEIEVGRWARPNRVPVDERKYKHCNTLEDEFHFLLECSLYRELRMQYIKRYFWNRPNVVKLKELMTSTNKRNEFLFRSVFLLLSIIGSSSQSFSMLISFLIVL